jgi:hypothetical protein
LGCGESESSRSIIGQHYSRVGTSTNGSSTSTKKVNVRFQSKNVMVKGMAYLNVISCSTNGSDNSKWKPTINVEFWK